MVSIYGFLEKGRSFRLQEWFRVQGSEPPIWTLNRHALVTTRSPEKVGPGRAIAEPANCEIPDAYVLNPKPSNKSAMNEVLTKHHKNSDYSRKKAYSRSPERAVVERLCLQKARA